MLLNALPPHAREKRFKPFFLRSNVQELVLLNVISAYAREMRF